MESGYSNVRTGSTLGWHLVVQQLGTVMNKQSDFGSPYGRLMLVLLASGRHNSRRAPYVGLLLAFLMVCETTAFLLPAAYVQPDQDVMENWSAWYSDHAFDQPLTATGTIRSTVVRSIASRHCVAR
jgi:hypothetical protein